MNGIRTLEEADLGVLFKLREVAFGSGFDMSDQEVRERMRKRLPRSRGYFVAGKLAASATMHPFQMFVAGKPVRMGGLAGVMSNPEHRRQGFVKALLLDGLERLRDEGVGWCLEYPFDALYYRRFGWQSVDNGYHYDVPSKLLFQGFSPTAERLESSDLGKLKPIYESWAKRYNFPLTREDSLRPGWSRIIRETWEKDEQLSYLLEDAYVIFSLKYDQDSRVFNYILDVRDYAFSSPQGRRNLFAFLGQFQGQSNSIKLHLSADEPLRYDAQHFLQHNGELQARVVDVKLALEGFETKLETSFVLSLQDDFCTWNNGCFQVTMEASHISINETKKSPDLSMDVRSLVLLVSGSLSAKVVHQLGLAEGDLQTSEALATLAAGRVPFIPHADFF